MIFQEPSDDQRQLSMGALGLIERSMPLARVRELAEGNKRVDVDHRRSEGALGWFSLLGTSGVSFDDRLHAAASVAEVRGAHLQPGTFIAANLLSLTDVASSLPMRERSSVSDTVASGDDAITWVCTDGTGHWGTAVTATSAARAIGATSTSDADRHRLNGTSGLVQDAHRVEWLLVRASNVDSGTIDTFVVASDAPGITITRLDGLDLTRTWSRVTFDNVHVDATMRARCDGSDTIADRDLQIAATLSMCETVGAVDQLFTRSVQYAKDRVAFGRPIGSFQAMKHLLADASVALETSKAMAEAAVVAVGTQQHDAAQIVAMAKSFIGDAALDIVNACWQTHGGIAYTWQHDFHLYLRRVTADVGSFGSPSWHREQLCRANGVGPDPGNTGGGNTPGATVGVR